MAKKDKKVTITLGRFQNVVNRLMRVHEVREECAKLGYPDGHDVTEHIVKEFERTHDIIDSGELSDQGYESDEMIGDEGRIACGYAHEDVFTELAEAMGYDESTRCLTDEEVDKIQKVYDVFFQE